MTENENNSKATTSDLPPSEQQKTNSDESMTPSGAFSDGLLEVPPASPLDRRDSLLKAIGESHKASRKTVRAKRGPAS